MLDGWPSRRYTEAALRSWIGSHLLATAVIGTLLAIAATAVLDAVGLGFNFLPLVILFFLFWWLQRLSRKALGLAWGTPADYGLAASYPVIVLAIIGIVAWAAGAASFSTIDWGPTLLNLAGQVVVTTLVAIVTEEGIFRGWLWVTLRRAEVGQVAVLFWTSAAFAAWHISTAILPTPFHPPLAQVPVYILNAGVIGFVWGQMRLRSGSILVTSFSHGLWNGLVYVLFGFGTTLGVFGIHNTAVFGPEIGLVGLALNVVFAAALWLTPSRPATRQPAVVAAAEAKA